MAKQKASKDGNDIGVDLAKAIAGAVTRVLSNYDFSPLNKSLVRGFGKVDISNLLKTDDAKIKQLATNVKDRIEAQVGTLDITAAIRESNITDIQKTLQQTPQANTAPLEKAGDLVRTLIGLTEQANKKTSITATLYKQIIDTADKLVASKRMEKTAAEEIIKTYQTKLPTQQLDVVLGKVDTSAVDAEIKKINLIGLQALVTEVDTSLVQEEVNKLNPLAFTSQVTLDSKQAQPPSPDTKAFSESNSLQQDSVSLAQQNAQAQEDIATASSSVTSHMYDQNQALINNVKEAEILKRLEEAKIGPAKELLKFLKEGKITYNQLGTIVGIITGEQGELNRAYQDGEEALGTILGLEDQVTKAIRQSGQTQAAFVAKNVAAARMRAQMDTEQYKQTLKGLTEDQKRNKINQDYLNFEKQALVQLQQREGARFGKLIGARKDLIGLIQSGVNTENLSQDSIKTINELLQDGDDLLRDQASTIASTHKLQKFVTAELDAGKSLQEIQNSQAYQKIKLAEQEQAKVQARLQAQAEGFKLNEEMEKSYRNSNKLLESTVQHSNLIFFKQVDVKQALEDQIRVREDLIKLAQMEGAAGEGARSLLKEEVTLYHQQAEVLGYEGQAAAYVAEQLAKGRNITKIQNDQQLETLEAQQKSIDFRKKDLELQLLTTKRVKEIREHHDKIKDKIKQALDFGKALAKEPMVAVAAAGAAIGHSLGHAAHQMHELMDNGMQAGEAIHMMRDNLSVMSVLGLSKVADVNKQLVSQFGTMNVLTEEQRHSIGEMATKFGLAGELERWLLNLDWLEKKPLVSA